MRSQPTRVFFNTYVWLMTSSISRGRLWLGIGFLLLIAGSFLVSSTLGEVRTLMTAAEVLDAWTRGNGRPDGELLGMTLPVPDSLIQTVMLLTAITFI